MRSQEVKFWEAHILLSAIRQGINTEQAKELLGPMEGTIKKMLKGIGFKEQDLEEPYPLKTLSRLIALHNHDPLEFERLIKFSTKTMVSKN